jgi:murein DD-endopeptidase MepM/ murein hydrolase activator NlpD
VERHPFPHLPRPAVGSAPKLLALSGALIGLLVTAMVVVPMAHADDLKNKHRKVQHSIKRAEAHLDDASAALTRALHRVEAAQGKLRTAEGRLQRARDALAEAREVDQQMQARLAQARQQLDHARVQLEKGKQAVADQRTDIGLMAASNYRNGDPRLMQLVVILKSQNPGDMVTQMNTVNNLMGRESNTLDGLQERRDQLAQREDQVEAAKDRVAEQREQTRLAVLRKRSLRDDAAQQRNEVLKLVRARQSASAHAAKIRQRDLARVSALKRQESSILAKIRARAAARARYRSAGGGFLYRPVPGYVTSPYGWRKHPIYGYWGLHDGTDFHAPCGTPLRAGNTGVVVSKYYSSVWGNRLFLDVGTVGGKRMVLIYNHISRYSASSGEHVSRGETIAYAGTTGWSTACHLHFTVTLDGNPVDPMKYL